MRFPPMISPCWRSAGSTERHSERGRGTMPPWGEGLKFRWKPRFSGIVLLRAAGAGAGKPSRSGFRTIQIRPNDQGLRSRHIDPWRAAWTRRVFVELEWRARAAARPRVSGLDAADLWRYWEAPPRLGRSRRI